MKPLSVTEFLLIEALILVWTNRGKTDGRS